MRVPLVDLSAQHTQLAGELQLAIARVVEQSTFILGEPVAALERALADVCGTPHAVGVASGSDALFLALRALGIGQGDAVLTTPFTFVATAEAIARVGATPVFCDIEAETLNLSPRAVEERLAARDARFRAMVPVHLFGRPCAMGRLADIAARESLVMVEDCAQALGADIGGAAVGGLGHAGALSFFPSKNVGAWGDGGAVVTRDAELAARVRRLRAHGANRQDEYTEIGLNSRLDTLQAAVLAIKVKRLSKWNEARALAATRYRDLLSGVGDLDLPAPDPGHSYSVFAVRTARRDALSAHLGARGVETRSYYATPLHRQPCFAPIAPRAHCPQAEAAAATTLAIPMYPEITPDQQNYVADQVRGFFS
jgi:dTDP-4-amino-4,6-dideoxygalactose transaminase